MSWYKCHMAGENFPGVLTNNTGLVGFYTTRYVEAESVQHAEELALLMLRDDPQLALPDNLVPSPNATVFFENIVMLADTELPPSTPLDLAFYMMDE